jgi:uncharacterized protein
MTLALKIIPRSPRTEFAGAMADGTRKVRIAAAPENGAANAELLRFLAREFQVPLHQVKIVAGASSTRKQVRIGG